MLKLRTARLALQCFRGAARTTQRKAQPQPGRGCRHPVQCPVRPAPVHADPHRIQFRLLDALVHQAQPASRAVLRPVRQRQVGLTLLAPPQAAPLPLFGPTDQPATHGIRLHVATDRQEMGIVLHRKTLEAALVEVAASATRVPSVMAPEHAWRRSIASARPERPRSAGAAPGASDLASGNR